MGQDNLDSALVYVHKAEIEMESMRAEAQSVPLTVRLKMLVQESKFPRFGEVLFRYNFLGKRIPNGKISNT